MTSPLATTPQVKTHWERADKSFHLAQDWGFEPRTFFEVLRDLKMGYTTEPSLLGKSTISFIYNFNGSNF